jgi:hypothetical protein
MDVVLLLYINWMYKMCHDITTLVIITLRPEMSANIFKSLLMIL